MSGGQPIFQRRIAAPCGARASRAPSDGEQSPAPKVFPRRPDEHRDDARPVPRADVEAALATMRLLPLGFSVRRTGRVENQRAVDLGLDATGPVGGSATNSARQATGAVPLPALVPPCRPSLETAWDSVFATLVFDLSLLRPGRSSCRAYCGDRIARGRRILLDLARCWPLAVLLATIESNHRYGQNERGLLSGHWVFWRSHQPPTSHPLLRTTNPGPDDRKK